MADLPKSWPSWFRTLCATLIVAVPIVAYLVVTGVTASAADNRSQENRARIGTLEEGRASSDARAEERHRAILQQLERINAKLDR